MNGKELKDIETRKLVEIYNNTMVGGKARLHTNIALGVMRFMHVEAALKEELVKRGYTFGDNHELIAPTFGAKIKRAITRG